MWDRLVEKSRARAKKAVAGRLEPGEAVEVVLAGVTRPSVWLLGISSLFVMRMRQWDVVLTDRRVFLVARSRWTARPSGVEWDEPRAGVRVDRFEDGKLMGRLSLRRVTDGRVLELRVNVRAFRSEVLAVEAALGG